MPSTSLKVGVKAAQTLYYAEEQAKRIGLPLNVSITIMLSLLGVPPENATKAFGKLRNAQFAQWVRRPSKAYATWAATPTNTYGFENSREGVVFEDIEGPHNVHVHWVAHVPPARFHDFEGQLYGWITDLAGSPDWPANALNVTRITLPGKVARYPLKGASVATALRYGVRAEDIKPQGIIIGKRTGTTVNIGPSARIELDSKLGIRRPHPR